MKGQQMEKIYNLCTMKIKKILKKKIVYRLCIGTWKYHLTSSYTCLLFN